MPRPAPSLAALALAACLALGGCAGEEGAAMLPGGTAMAMTATPGSAAGPPPEAPPADPAPEGGEAAAAADPPLLLSTDIVASLAGLRLLDSAGRAALPPAEARLAGAAGAADRCALAAFLAVAAEAGPADGARFAVWLAGRARGAQDAAAGLAGIAAGIVEEVGAGAGAAGLEAARLLAFEDPDRLRAAIGLARAAAGRCPADAAERLGTWLDAAGAA